MNVTRPAITVALLLGFSLGWIIGSFVDQAIDLNLDSAAVRAFQLCPFCPPAFLSLAWELAKINAGALAGAVVGLGVAISVYWTRYSPAREPPLDSSPPSFTYRDAQLAASPDVPADLPTPDDETAVISIAPAPFNQPYDAVEVEAHVQLAESEQQLARWRALAETGAALMAEAREGDPAQIALTRIAEVVTCDRATLWLKDQAGRFVIAATRPTHDAWPVPAPSPLVFLEIETNRAPVIVDDAGRDGRFPQTPASPFAGWLGVPVVSGKESLGVLALEKIEPGFYGEADAALAGAYASFAGEAFAQSSRAGGTAGERG
jgi:hypothetical protein